MFHKEPAKNPLTFQLDKTGSQLLVSKGFPDHSDSEESVCKAGDPGLIPRLGRSPVEGNGNPLQYSCLENLMDRGEWQATVHVVTRVRHNLAYNIRTRGI